MMSVETIVRVVAGLPDEPRYLGAPTRLSVNADNFLRHVRSRGELPKLEVLKHAIETGRKRNG